jgi:N-methylhydantoinase A
MQLDAGRAEKALMPLCDKTGFSLVELAAGIVKVANANMGQGIRVVSVERGHDPRDFTLLAFGGAGPLHACELARELTIPRVLIPIYPGVFSALGMVVADIKHEFVLTRRMNPDEDTTQVFDSLECTARTVLQQEGILPEKMVLERYIDARYVGQSYEIRVPARHACTRFHEAHKTLYGYSDPSSPVEYVNFRVVGIGKQKKITLKTIEKSQGPPPIKEKRLVFFHDFIETPVYRRESLGQGDRLQGPAVIEEMESTLLLPPGWLLHVDQFGNILVEVKE